MTEFHRSPDLNHQEASVAREVAALTATRAGQNGHGKFTFLRDNERLTMQVSSRPSFLRPGEKK